MLRLRLLTAAVSGSQARARLRTSGEPVGVEVDHRRVARILADHRVDREAEARAGVERIDHVQIVGPGLGEVLPGVHGRIGADVGVLPARLRPVLVVALDRLGIALPLVAEDRPALLDPAGVRDQQLLVVMPGLVPHVAEQRPVGLAERHPLPLALGRSRPRRC